MYVMDIYSSHMFYTITILTWDDNVLTKRPIEDLSMDYAILKSIGNLSMPKKDVRNPMDVLTVTIKEE